jgi:hypothetical protein
MTISGLSSLIVAVSGCAAIILIGLRFLLLPRQASLAYGIEPNNIRALTAIKGVRDIVSGVVPLIVWRVAGRSAFGWAMFGASLTPIGDALIVMGTGGKWSAALGIHGVTALVLVVVGIILGRGW